MRVARRHGGEPLDVGGRNRTAVVDHARQAVHRYGDPGERRVRRPLDLDAAVFAETELAAPEMAKVRKVLDDILHGSEPNPTFVLDSRQNVVATNRGMERFLRATLGTVPAWHRDRPNFVRVVRHPDGLRRVIVNWDEVARGLLHRVHGEAGPIGPSPRMQAVLDEWLAFPDIPSRWAALDVEAAPSVVIPMHVARDGLELRLFSTVTTVGAPRDLTTQELRIECFIPADDASEHAIERLAEADP